MRAFLILFTKELRSFFLSPLAWVVMALFTFLNGWLFVNLVQAMRLQVSPRSLVYNLFDSGWFWMGFFILFPLLTMRLFAEERKMGTLEGLLTAPVRTIEVLLAKYLATLVVYAAILVPVLLFFPVFQLITGESAAYQGGAFRGAMLGLLLVGALHVAMGVFASSVTSNQLIAAMLTFVLVMMHYFLGFLSQSGVMAGSIWSEALSYFSTTGHMQLLSEGLIDSRPILYYVTASTLILAFTHHILESRKWRA
ncbi:MAG: ABC transporter permease subunit [Verrucomicrobiota bacterium]